MGHQEPAQSYADLVARPEDVIIAVMGITGCGKTTFVNQFTDADHKLVVGHGLESCMSLQAALSAKYANRWSQARR